MTSTIKANVTSTLSINSDDKTERYNTDCNIFHLVLLVVIFLFKIAIICYHYATQEMYWHTNDIKNDKK